MTDEDQANMEWSDKQDELLQDGQDLVGRASDEALDYLADAVENMNDKQWRKMSVETQAIEMGIGIGLAEIVVPKIYEDMKKAARKKLKVKADTAEVLRRIYIGRVVKNIRKELNARDQQL